MPLTRSITSNNYKKNFFMKTLLTQDKGKLLLLGITIGIRILFFYFLVGPMNFSTEISTGFYPDSETYIHPANSIATIGQFLNNEGIPEIIRTPGYPLFLALFISISLSYWVEIVIIIQVLLNILSVLLLYNLILDLTENRKAALIGGLLASVNLHDVYFSGFILSDSLFQSLLWIASFFFVAFLKKGSFTNLFVAAILFAFGFFVRPVSLYLPVCLAIGVFIHLSFQKKYRKSFYAIGILLFTCYLPASLWQIRNQNLTGFRGFSAISSHNLYYYHTAGINAINNGTDFYTEQDNLKKDQALQDLTKVMSLQEAEFSLAKDTILSNLPLFALLTIKGTTLILFYPSIFDIIRLSPDGLNFIDIVKNSFLNSGFKGAIQSFVTNPAGILTVLNIILLGIIFICMCFGIFGSIKKISPPIVFVAMAGIFLYFLLISSGPNGYGTYPRFRLTVSFYQAFFAGLFFVLYPLKKKT